MIKRLTKKILTLAKLAMVAFWIPTVSAQVIWTEKAAVNSQVRDYFKRLDRGNYPKDYCHKHGDEKGVAPSSVTAVNDPTYGMTWKVNKPKMRKRAELARTEGKKAHYSPQDGDDIYIGWRWKIHTQDEAKIKDEVTVFQWKSKGRSDQNYPINMEYDGELTLNAWGPDYERKTSRKTMRSVLWRRKVPQDTWVSLVIRIKLNRNDHAGIIQFWFNGEQQMLKNQNTKKYKVKLSKDKKTAFHRTADGEFVYPKWGAYNKKSCSYDINTFFNEMKIGKSLEAVLPLLIK